MSNTNPPANKIHSQALRTLTIRMPVGLHEILRRHAFERNVSANTLVSDVLTLWAYSATDPKDPIFMPRTIGVELPDMPTEEGKYAGYLDSLVWTVDLLERNA
jgi:hypothetical protein